VSIIETDLLHDPSEVLRGPVALCHLFLRAKVKPGDRVIDATCGNGGDTLVLAGLVGIRGKVWSFDIENDALTRTKGRLEDEGSCSQVELIRAGHENLAGYVAEPVQTVVFNLGYLPGSSKETVTRPETTLIALDQASRLLLPGGVILVVVYTGHPGGQEEGCAVDQWAAELPSLSFNVWSNRMINRQPHAPYLLMVEKMN
jgi:ubiquinone/menaquinone biosynthesis C-methylase UbiE